MRNLKKVKEETSTELLINQGVDIRTRLLSSGQCHWTRWIRDTCRISNASSGIGHWTQAKPVDIRFQNMWWVEYQCVKD